MIQDWVLQQIVGGQWCMSLLYLCSVVALAAILDRCVALRRRRILGPVATSVSEISSPEDLGLTRRLCDKERCLLARVIRVIFETNGNEELVRSAGRMGAEALDRRLNMLEIVAMICPLLGLLGTVLGMNQVFHAVSVEGLGNVRAFSEGIALALNTTIVGLCIAIPAYIAHLVFERKMERLVNEVEYWTTIALEKHRQYRAQEIPA